MGVGIPSVCTKVVGYSASLQSLWTCVACGDRRLSTWGIASKQRSSRAIHLNSEQMKDLLMEGMRDLSQPPTCPQVALRIVPIQSIPSIPSIPSIQSPSHTLPRYRLTGPFYEQFPSTQSQALVLPSQMCDVIQAPPCQSPCTPSHCSLTVFPLQCLL